jgi:hypothetical protein
VNCFCYDFTSYLESFSVLFCESGWRIFIVDVDFGVVKYNGGQFLLFRRQVNCVE